MTEPAVPWRYATPRTPGRRSYGAAVDQVAGALGKPGQPWQRDVWDVGTELLDDGSWAYRIVAVTVQRQAGKTTLLGPKNLHRCLTRQRAKTWLTAQTRQDGRDTWRDVAELVSRSPLRDLVSVRRSNGSEELAVAATGSTFRVFAPSEDALHGKANESVDVDEGWAFDAVQGLGLEQAILPTFATTGGQLWLTSTAGTAASTWLRGFVDRGRAAVESGRRDGIAYFECSLQPSAAEVVTATLTEIQQAGGKLDERLAQLLDAALDLVLAAHPGRFVRRDAIRDAALTMSPGEFLRAYGNVWTLTSDQVIADHHWRACHDRALPPPEPGSLSLSFDVALDRSSSAIGAGWRHGTRPAVDVVDERPGSSWLVERVEQMARRLRVDEVGCDGAGPALDVADELERRGVVRVRRLTMREYATACASFLAGVDSHQLVHRHTPALDRAVAAAARREVGDGLWLWSRRSSAASIAGLVAGTVAVWTFDHRPAPMPAPVVVAGRASSTSSTRSPAPARRSLTSR